MAEGVSKNSYDETVDSVPKTTGASVPRRQGEELSVRASADFKAFYQTWLRRSPQVRLWLSALMAKGIVMRTEDLREQSRKRAESQAHKLSKRLYRGECQGRRETKHQTNSDSGYSLWHQSSRSRTTGYRGRVASLGATVETTTSTEQTSLGRSGQVWRGHLKWRSPKPSHNPNVGIPNTTGDGLVWWTGMKNNYDR